MHLPTSVVHSEEKTLKTSLLPHSNLVLQVMSSLLSMHCQLIGVERMGLRALNRLSSSPRTLKGALGLHPLLQPLQLLLRTALPNHQSGHVLRGHHWR